ncbi:hypothetical protein [Streptomyces sp. Ac-502]|uniref:hypothetical protein n=1 Tax=Streptomyces sp. Ac-502 TaxID=3342801 RepID=UPI00386271CA
MVFALLPAFWGSKVRRTVYQQDAELSDQQAIRDIRELVRLGWLVPHGKARARFYASGPRMEVAQREVRQSVALTFALRAGVCAGARLAWVALWWRGRAGGQLSPSLQPGDPHGTVHVLVRDIGDADTRLPAGMAPYTPPRAGLASPGQLGEFSISLVPALLRVRRTG